MGRFDSTVDPLFFQLALILGLGTVGINAP
jgi:hypothetical protein